MAEAADIASELEELQRQEALAKRGQTNSLASATWCIDCDEVIPHKRRKLLPGVQRCVDCAAIEEKRARWA